MPTKTTSSRHDPAIPESARDMPLSPDERDRLMAELEAELEAGERSIREEGVVTAQELERHLDALFAAWEAEENGAAAPDKGSSRG